MDTFKLEIPVVMIVFKRMDTTVKVFEKIRQAKPSKLYIISDGAHDNNEEEKNKVLAVRDYLEKNIDWDCELIKEYSDVNLGSRHRIVTGLDKVFANEEMAIIIEDDILVHDTFFRFCQEMLYKYKDDERIAMVTGCNTNPDYVSEDAYFFTKLAEIWGWGTYRRVWETYDADITDWEKYKANNYFAKYYNNKVYGKELAYGMDLVKYKGLDAWDYQWVYNMALHSQYGIMPAVNLIENIGFNSADATHTQEKSRFVFKEGEIKFPIKHPKYIVHEADYDKTFIKKNYDYGKLKKLFLMIDSYITIHFRNKK